MVFSYEDEAIQKLGLDYDSLRHLESIGVITLGTMNYSVQFEKEYGYFTYYDKSIMMKIGTRKKNTFMPIKQNSVDIGMVLLTNIGIELIRICGSKPDDNYFYSALKEFMEENEIFTPLQ